MVILRSLPSAIKAGIKSSYPNANLTTKKQEYNREIPLYSDSREAQDGISSFTNEQIDKKRNKVGDSNQIQNTKKKFANQDAVRIITKLTGIVTLFVGFLNEGYNIIQLLLFENQESPICVVHCHFSIHPDRC